MNALTCDECGKTAPADEVFGWYEAVLTLQQVHHLGEREGPWHFCGSHCLTAWAASRWDQEKER